MDINVILDDLKLASYSFWLGLIFSLISLVLVIIKKAPVWLILLVISITVTVVSASLMLNSVNLYY